jgi:hypothetical protein
MLKIGPELQNAKDLSVIIFLNQASNATLN